MSHTTNNITLVCYDITSNKLRRRIDQCLKDFGVRLQFSVFLCRLDKDGINRCREKLMKVLNAYRKEQGPGDSLIIFERFHPNVADCLLGEPIPWEGDGFGIY